ncbi:restriction endonuclease subunit S [Pediococcus pentosaceus]|uniref:restriction endonuclease subunit S n=1 Tax=Pediococcus pentosaceus TaxID=1255 RepID=UPI0013300CA7|nr:restriction endonuclease subunit S [Pediococcus pentosaceus]KAF0505166.1 restriction endonuclease subunit S [Pediococcus pentosaceus]
MSNKVPQIRFNGYSDAWVQRNLAELSDGFSYGLNAAAKEYDGVHGYLRITDIDEVSHLFSPEGITSPDVPEDQLTDYQMDEQSIVYARTGASTGKTYIYRDSDGELYYAGFLIRQKVNKENSAQFVYQNTLTTAWERHVQVMSQRSGQPGINAQEVGRFELSVPEKAEQDKIADLFKNLDSLIAANQRKVDLLKEQKKGYLQKMFPKNGAKVPELRFAGFADDWEERKLRDLLNKNSEKNKNLSVINVESVSNKTGFTKQTDQFEDYSVASADLSNYYVIREKQFAYNPSRINVGSIAYKDLGDEISVVSPLYVSFSTKKVLNDGFLWNWFKTASFDAQRQRLSEGGVRDTLSFNQLSEMNTMFPTYPEQEKIASFFKQLDDTIALHQRKLDLLKEQKKGFLQNMFV